ncbi:MAG: putative glycosyl transferase [Spirochaetes bacterium ADurb.Bin110]|nr:MAG: putative glycosyl transferase [Spirochaetes bacterium ADurb.Bin110]
MKILVVCQYYYPEPFKVSELCEGLVNKGYSVTVLTGIPNYPEGEFYKGYGFFKKSHERINGVDVIRIPILPRGRSNVSLILNYVSFAISGLVYNLLSSKRFDYVFLYQLSPILMAIPAITFAKIHRIPLVFYVLDLWPESFIETQHISNQIITGAFYKISKSIYKTASRIAVSSNGFIDLLQKMHIDKRKMVYIPQFASYCNQECKNDSIEISDPEAFTIIFAGNIGFAQGLEVVLEAAVITEQSTPYIKWILLGEGRAKKSLELQCRSRRIRNVQFLNRVSSNDAEIMIKKADAALLVLRDSLLYSITLPAKMQTYMACGVPILCSANGEAARIVIEARAGLASKAGDAIALANNAIRLSKTSEYYLGMYRDNARNYFLNHFTKQKHVDAISSLFNVRT